MLVKLFKHEFKYSASRFLPFAGILLIFSLLTRFIIGANMNSYNTPEWIEFISGIMSFVFYTLVFLFSIITLVICVQRYEKNIFGNEGYLTLTLPVPQWQHVLVKVVTATFWSLVNGAIAILVFAISIPESGIFSFIIEEIIKPTLESLAMLFDRPAAYGVILAALTIIIMTATLYMAIYSASTINQSFSKRSRLTSFLASIGLFFLITVFLRTSWSLFDKITDSSPNLFFSPFYGSPHYDAVAMSAAFRSIAWFNLGLTAVLMVALFFLSSYLLTKKVDIQ